MLLSDSLSVKNEDIVVKSLLRWSNFHKGTGILLSYLTLADTPLDKLVFLVRWPYVSTTTLWACASNPVLSSIQGLSDKFTEAIVYQAAPVDKKKSAHTSYAKRESYLTQAEVQPQDFAKNLLAVFQTVGKNSTGQELLTSIANEFFVFMPQEPKRIPTVDQTTEFTFGTTHLITQETADTNTSVSPNKGKQPVNSNV